MLRPAVRRTCPGKHWIFSWPQNEDPWNDLKSGVPRKQASPAKIICSYPRAQGGAEGLSKKNKLEGALFSQDQEPWFLWEKPWPPGNPETGMLGSAQVHFTQRRRILFEPSGGFLTTSRTETDFLPWLSRVWGPASASVSDNSGLASFPCPFLWPPLCAHMCQAVPAWECCTRCSSGWNVLWETSSSSCRSRLKVTS